MHQPFEDFTKIKKNWVHFLFIFGFFGHFWSSNSFDSYHIVFGVSNSINPQKMGSLTSQIAEIITQNANSDDVQSTDWVT